MKNLTNEDYNALVSQRAMPSPMLKNTLWAFFVGGGICAFGQLLVNLYKSLGLDKEQAGTAGSLTLILIAAVLTGLGIFDAIAKRAGAGTLVPITGFANAVVSPAVEFKTETMTLGSCTKMFTIAGPVIVYGVTASVIYGIVLVLLQSF